jgi:hypothetical protein
MALPSLEHRPGNPPDQSTRSWPQPETRSGIKPTASTEILVAGRRIQLLARQGLPLVDLRLNSPGTDSVPIGEIRGADSDFPHLTVRPEHIPWACDLVAYNQLRTCALTFWRTAQGDRSYWPGIGSAVLSIEAFGPARIPVVFTYRYNHRAEIGLSFLSREPRSLGRAAGFGGKLPALAGWSLHNSDWLRTGSTTRRLIDHAYLTWLQRDTIIDRLQSHQH